MLCTTSDRNSKGLLRSPDGMVLAAYCSSMKPSPESGQTKDEQAYYSLNRLVYGSGIFPPLYDIIIRPIRRLRYEVTSMLEFSPGAKVLDIATGTGEQALAFGERGFEVVGVDISEAMLGIAKRKNRFSNVTFRCADATALPFEDQSFDAACISFGLHEMPPSIRKRVVHEMVRVTKVGGTILVVDYGLPRNKIASTIVYHLVKLYERDSYAEFVQSDLDALLMGAGIELQEQREPLREAARIIKGRRSNHS
jgi:SAM-dependent methyltransferase